MVYMNTWFPVPSVEVKNVKHYLKIKEILFLIQVYFSSAPPIYLMPAPDTLLP